MCHSASLQGALLEETPRRWAVLGATATDLAATVVEAAAAVGVPRLAAAVVEAAAAVVAAVAVVVEACHLEGVMVEAALEGVVVAARGWWWRWTMTMMRKRPQQL